MSNLEPIEEGDLNLKEKFLGGIPAKIEKAEVGIEKTEEIVKSEEKEIPIAPEKTAERKEGQAEKDAAYAKIVSMSTVPASAVKEEEVVSDAQVASTEQDAESKISNLVKLAEVKGLPHAVKVARHLEDNYVLDEFHDRLLSEELHKALVEKGLVREI